MILLVVLFSFVVSESCWSLDLFVKKNSLKDQEMIPIYVEGVNRKGEIFLVEKGSSVQDLLHRTGLRVPPAFVKKMFRKPIEEEGSFYVPFFEDFSPSWDNSLWMENWQKNL
jgi:hypothetical protein